MRRNVTYEVNCEGLVCISEICQQQGCSHTKYFADGGRLAHNRKCILRDRSTLGHRDSKGGWGTEVVGSS